MGDHLPHVYVAGSSCQACYSMLSDPAVREWMRKLEQDEEFRRKVAYGRLYHLRETRMLELSNY